MGDGAAFNPKDSKNIEEFLKQVKKGTEDLKKSQPTGLKAFENLLNGVKDTGNAFDEVKRDLDQLDKAIKKAKDANNVIATQALESEKAEKIKASASIQTSRAMNNLAIGMGTVAGTMMKGALDFVEGLMSSQSGVEIATKASVNSVKAGYQLSNAFAELATSLGPFLMFVKSFGAWGKIFGGALAVGGIALKSFNKATEETATRIIESLGKEVGRTQKAFSDITSTGASFAGGLTELRKQAAYAGLDVEQWAKAIKSSKEDLTLMGGGVTEANKRLAGVSRELRDPNNGLGMQLRKLGYSAEEQVELAASLMANQNAAGRQRIMSDKEVAATTVQYGRDLKVLAAITGEDAKKALEKARLKSMEADILAQLTASGDPKAVEKFQRQFAILPEGLKKGYMEFVASGGQFVADAATNVAMQTNSKILPQFQQMHATLSDLNKDESYAQSEASKLTEKTAQFQRDNLDTVQSIALGARVIGDGLLQSVTDIANGLILFNTKVAPGTTKIAEDAADRARIASDTLSTTVHGIEESMQKLKAQLTDRLTPSLAGAATAAYNFTETLEQTLERLGIISGGGGGGGNKQPGFWSQAAGNMATYGGAGAAAGGAIGATAGGIGAVPGALIGGGVGIAGGLLQTVIDRGMLGGGNSNNKMTSDYDGLNIGGKWKGEAVAGGPAEKELVDKARKLQAMYPTGVFNALNDTTHNKSGAHGRGRALDFGLNFTPTVEEGKDITARIRELGFRKVIDEYNFPGAEATGGHIHAEMADGGNLGPNQSAIVGERGPEIIHGPGSVTSTAATSKIFNEMLRRLEELINVSKDNRDVSEKILQATQ